MPDSKQNQGQRKSQDVERERQGNIGPDKGQDQNIGQQQSDRGKEGSKGSAQEEREGRPVGNNLFDDEDDDDDDDEDDDDDDDDDDDAITQRNPRMGAR